MNGVVAVTLSHGYWIDGVCHRQAELRPLTGDDEAFVPEIGEALLPAAGITALLARCVVRIGSQSEVTPDTIRSLTIGDREALLLNLRRLTMGDRLQCVLNCPHPDCGQKMDLELKISDLLIPVDGHSQQRYAITMEDAHTRYRVCFRLPTGADAELAAELALTDPQAAADQLLRRCVEDIACEDCQQLDDLPPIVAADLPATLSELDPQAELRLNLTCPECGQRFSALFDAGSYFFQEITGSIDRLYREVHLLAFHYHWSESEIMGMTRRKRHRYLNLLAEALSQG
jgi:hypothetical protein